MGEKSKIAWTDATWNFLRGCTHVSEGCRNCYAERLSHWLVQSGMPYEGLDIVKGTPEGPKWTGKMEFAPEMLEIPLNWKKPRKIFVNSMSDTFHPDIPAEIIINGFEVMAACRQHTFQVLTKRPERIGPVLYGEEGRWYLGGGDFLPNVWLGFSAEDQETFDARALEMVKSGWPGIRWVSLEPLLGRTDISAFVYQLSWVVVGGESGPSAKPTHPDWVRSIRDCCVAAGVPFFFKQWGEWGPVTYYEARGIGHPTLPTFSTDAFEVFPLSEDRFLPGIKMGRVGKKAAGRLLDGREWNEFPAA